MREVRVPACRARMAEQGDELGRAPVDQLGISLAACWRLCGWGTESDNFPPPRIPDVQHALEGLGNDVLGLPALHHGHEL